MKKLLSLCLAAAIALPLTVDAQSTNSTPQPKCLPCILTYLTITVFILNGYVCYFNGMRHQLYPEVYMNPPKGNFIDLPGPPAPGGPLPCMVAGEAFSANDCSTNNWTDESATPNVPFTAYLETLIQSADSLSGSWGDLYHIQYWHSSNGNLCLVSDANWTPIATNYCMLSATNSPAIPWDRSKPQQFYRAVSP